MRGFEFKITLSRDEVSCVLDTPEREGQIIGPFPIEPKLHLATIEVLDQWLKRWEWIANASTQGSGLLVPDTFKVLGHHLWYLALDNDIGRRLIQVYSEVAERDEDHRIPLRFRVAFEQGFSGLASLPWEYVRYPGGHQLGGPREGFFLAAQTSLVLGRFLDELGDREIRVADLKVRALFVLVLPDLPGFKKQYEEFDSLLNQVAKIGDAIDIELIRGWRPLEVAERLQELKDAGRVIDVVHLVAICEDTKDGPRLHLPPDNGNGDWEGKDPRPVVQSLTEDRSTRPELVVLHLSDLRGTEPPAHFERLAPDFIKAGIPAVLAMQYPMANPHGQDFIVSFYSSLARGAAIGEAVQRARHALNFGQQLNRHFGAPVLYMQSKVDSRLLQTRAASEGTIGLAGLTLTTRPEAGETALAWGRPADILQTLLEELPRLSPDLETMRAVREWVISVNWPDDLNRVWHILQGRRRERLDEPAEEQVYAGLMGKIAAIGSGPGR